MRRMFHHCKLVHADLSEYNILYVATVKQKLIGRLHDSHLYIIDVSQSVERDHPRTFDFLRTDIRNINDFFARRSVGDVQILGIRRTWDFIVSDFIGSLTREEEMGEAGESRLMCIAASWLEEDAASLEKQAQGVEQRSGDAAGQESISSTAGDEAVFMSSFIPRSLAEVFDPERDFEILKGGDGDQLIYAGLTGLESSKGDNTRSVSQSDGSECSQPERDRVGRLKKVVRFEGEEGDETSNQEEPNRTAQTRSRGFRHEGKEAKKVNGAV